VVRHGEGELREDGCEPVVRSEVCGKFVVASTENAARTCPSLITFADWSRFRPRIGCRRVSRRPWSASIGLLTSMKDLVSPVSPAAPLMAMGAPIRWRGQVQMIGGSTSLPVVDESIVDLVGIRMGMNCGPMLPLMPTTEPLWSLFVQVVPLCFWL
jgi:hypothetical protein